MLSQGWRTLVDTIRLLPLYPPKDSTKVTEAEREHALALAIAEKRTVDDALDQVALLIRLRQGETLAPGLIPTLTAKAPTHSIPITPAPLPAVNTAVPAVSTNSPAPTPQTAGVKRKHRVSVSASPAPPALGTGRDGLMVPLTASRHASPMPGTGKASANQVPRTITRREMLHDQLPLKVGRKVAYKQTAEQDIEEGWILCSVNKVFPGDRNQYEVVDDDDASMCVILAILAFLYRTGSLASDAARCATGVHRSGRLTNRTHMTTIKSILPLPDASLPITSLGHPNNLEDWPIGSKTLGLYPQTTTFYEAEVISAPAPGTGHGLGPRGGTPKRRDAEALSGRYRLRFVDDDEVQEVDKDHVVPVSLFIVLLVMVHRCLSICVATVEK